MEFIIVLLILWALIILRIIIGSFKAKETANSSNFGNDSPEQSSQKLNRAVIQDIAPDYISLTDIREATSRCSYTARELEILVNYIEYNQKRGLDTSLGALCNEDTVKDGILIISSPDQIDRDIVLVKLNAGKGLFGGQKAAYGFYLGITELDSYQPGATHKHFGVALTSINNIYRAIGLL